MLHLKEDGQSHDQRHYNGCDGDQLHQQAVAVEGLGLGIDHSGGGLFGVGRLLFRLFGGAFRGGLLDGVSQDGNRGLFLGFGLAVDALLIGNIVRVRLAGRPLLPGGRLLLL